MNEARMRERGFETMKADKSGQAASQAKTGELEEGSRSFEELFLEHWTRVYQALLRLVGDPAEAEDLALETFLRLYQKRPPSHEGFNLGGWLHRVATNLGLHSIRSFQRRERYELAAGKGALETAGQDHPAEVVADEEERRMVRQILAQMSPRQAELLAMRYSGMAYKEIAAALGISPTSVGPLLLRAEREFEKQYRARDQEAP